MEKQWPAGLRVLAVDNDPQVLAFIKKVCSQCHYHVTICSESPVALNLVWERKDWIDVILMEVHMPHMDGCEFLRHVRYQIINIPVIIMSRDSDTSSVMKAIKFGACDYWIKPLHECQFKNMWTHVVKKILSRNKVQKDLGSLENDDRRKRGNYNSEPASSDVDESEPCGSSSKKKARVIWSPQLHREFVKAVNQIGLDQAVPKKIHELMNNPALTRDSVASHLQKYRHYLKSRSNRVTQTQQQNELALADNVPRTTEYRVGTSGTFHLAATRPVTYHRAVASLSPGMIPKIENQSDPSTHAEQGLGYGQMMGKYAFANDNANNFHQSDPSTHGELGLGYGQMMGKYAFANDNANNFHSSVSTVDIEQQRRHQQIPVQHSLSVLSENTFHFNRYTSSASNSQQLQNSGFTSGAVRSSPASVSPESSPSGFTIKDNTTEDS